VLGPGQHEVIVFYARPNFSPYLDWLDSLDEQNRARIQTRVVRLRSGQFGDYKKLDQKLYELRLFFGPGYRVYFGEHKAKRIILLLGGDKSSQRSDIKKAKELWKIYVEERS
jgi:putative addiction module killer protein